MWRKPSFIAFFSSLVLMLLLYLHLRPFGLAVPDSLYILGVFTFGFLGFTFSVISIFLKPSRSTNSRREQILVFHVGMVIVFFGIITRLLFWPYTEFFFIVGLILIGISFLFKNKKTMQDNDILDG